MCKSRAAAQVWNLEESGDEAKAGQGGAGITRCPDRMVLSTGYVENKYVRYACSNTIRKKS